MGAYGDVPKDVLLFHYLYEVIILLYSSRTVSFNKSLFLVFILFIGVRAVFGS